MCTSSWNQPFLPCLCCWHPTVLKEVPHKNMKITNLLTSPDVFLTCREKCWFSMCCFRLFQLWLDQLQPSARGCRRGCKYNKPSKVLTCPRLVQTLAGWVEGTGNKHNCFQWSLTCFVFLAVAWVWSPEEQKHRKYQGEAVIHWDAVGFYQVSKVAFQTPIFSVLPVQLCFGLMIKSVESSVWEEELYEVDALLRLKLGGEDACILSW